MEVILSHSLTTIDLGFQLIFQTFIRLPAFLFRSWLCKSWSIKSRFSSWFPKVWEHRYVALNEVPLWVLMARGVFMLNVDQIKRTLAPFSCHSYFNKLRNFIHIKQYKLSYPLLKNWHYFLSMIESWQSRHSNISQSTTPYSLLHSALSCYSLQNLSALHLHAPRVWACLQKCKPKSEVSGWGV